MSCSDTTYSNNNQCRFPTRSCGDCEYDTSARKRMKLGAHGITDVVLKYKGGAEVELPADVVSMSYVPRPFPPKKPKYKKVALPTNGQIHTIAHSNERDGQAIPVRFKGEVRLPSTAINITLFNGEISYEVPVV